MSKTLATPSAYPLPPLAKAFSYRNSVFRFYEATSSCQQVMACRATGSSLELGALAVGSFTHTGGKKSSSTQGLALVCLKLALGHSGLPWEKHCWPTVLCHSWLSPTFENMLCKHCTVFDLKHIWWQNQLVLGLQGKREKRNYTNKSLYGCRKRDTMSFMELRTL